jgi:branched-chain amino acid transport system permease protein
VLNLFFAAVVLSGLYSLIGFAWVLLARNTGILNLATGAYIALGAYVYNELATNWRLAWPLVAIGTLAAIAVIATLTQLVVFRRLAGQPEFVLVIATLGLASVLEGGSSIIWGQQARLVRSPITDHPLHLIGGIFTTLYGIIGVIVAAVVLAAALLFFRYASTGVRMRAAAENPVLAAQGRLPIDRMYILGWFMALVAATLAGILFAYETALSYPGLASLGLRGMAPALVGGLTSVKGVVPGALIVALAETFGVHWFGGSASDLAAWLLIFVVLMIRPEGLFGERRVERV